jgi:small conductance mechanosensitive channel
MDDLENNLETVNKLVDMGIEFGVKYGFQLLGAIAFFFVGFLVINWIGNRLAKIAVARNIDQTLSQFIGSAVKLVLMVMLVIITLGNFGISIAPLIALAGAVSLGATLALQGPISNFGAGVAIILTRPFVVGNVISVLGISGIVDKVTLGMTFLTGEDGEKISIPNKEIVGQVIVNSHTTRILENTFCVPADADVSKLIPVIKTILDKNEDIIGDPAPQVGIHGFTYGGVVIGYRAWVPGRTYFQVRYDANMEILNCLRALEISLFEPEGAALSLPNTDATTQMPYSVSPRNSD